MRHAAALLAALTLAAAAAPDALRARAAQAGAPRVLRVTRAADDAAAGTLRWAIATSNATPEPERIEIDLAPDAVITPGRALPAIRGPVAIEGAGWRRSGRHAVIDGSGYVPPGLEGCPGAAAGHYGANVRTMTLPGLQVIDTDDVEIAGVEIRRFCIGVLINRSTRVTIRDSRIAENRGGAGVMLTGDDGKGNPTDTTTVHNKVLRSEFVDNGDGLELTRGAAFNLVAANVFRSTAANPEPSQGIEILRGHDNVVAGNRFEGYSDGLQINWGDRNFIVSNTFAGNAFGLNLTGVGNVVDSNVISGNRIGIVVRPADPAPLVRLTRNRITGNGRDIVRCEAGGSCDPAAPKGATVFGLPGLEHASFVGSRGRGATPDAAALQHICPAAAPRCQAAPNQGLPPPILTAARIDHAEMAVSGRLRAAPASSYVVELFGNSDPAGEEGELFLNARSVHTDASGHAAFDIRFDSASDHQHVRSVTATVTSVEGATSPLGAAIGVSGPGSR